MLSGTEARLASSMQASVDLLCSDLVAERKEREASLEQINARLDAHETRMAALEAVLVNAISPQDPQRLLRICLSRWWLVSNPKTRFTKMKPCGSSVP